MKNKREIIIIQVIFFIIFILLISACRMDRVQAKKDPCSEAQNSFVKNLYMSLSKSGQGNLFFSPFSIRAAMAMVYIGAKSNTQIQIKKALNFSDDKNQVLSEFKDLILDLFKENEEYTLHTSNSAYISKRMSILHEFSTILQEYFQSKTKLVNYEKAEEVRLQINSDVERETKSLIKDLIPKGSLNHMTRMVLVNAIYFKGLWEHPFPTRNTREGPFWTGKDTSLPVSYMTYQDYVNYAILDDLKATMIALNYKGQRLHMAIVLPDERDGLEALESKLEAVKFSQMEEKLSRQKVKVTLPKFKLEESLEVISTFKQLGLLDLFDPKQCDLSGIDGTKDLYVSNIFHKAFVDVNEEGTEAAAATGILMMSRSMVIVPKFIADHPFLFYIRDRPSGQILFAGRFKTPPQNSPVQTKEDL